MIKFFVGILLVVSAVSNAQQTHEEFVGSRLFGILADPNSLGIRDTGEKLEAAIQARIQIEPETSRAQLLSELSDSILNHKGWITTDKVTRAADNFVSVLLEDPESIGLLTRFQYSLRQIAGAIESGWTAGDAKTLEPKRRRAEALIEIHDRIEARRNEIGGRRIASFATLCSVVYTGLRNGNFKPNP